MKQQLLDQRASREGIFLPGSMINDTKSGNGLEAYLLA